jgi:hypothetical protein
VILYVDSLALGFEDTDLRKYIKNLIRIRGDLFHHLDSELLNRNPGYLYILQKIFEQVIIRLLGIDKSIEEKFIFHQNNEPKKV